jgi:uncharacterized protein with gpF-like domain
MILAQFLQLLHDHKDELLVLVSLFAVCVSLVTATIAPIIQMKIARLSASTSVLIANRVKWIETMQSDIATYTAVMERAEFLHKTMAELKVKFPKLNDKQSEEFNKMFQEYEERTLERNKLGNLIGIRLDVSTEKRQMLFEAIDNFAKHTGGLQTGSPEQLVAINRVQQITRDVLSQEWAWVERQIGKPGRSR